MYSVHPVNTGKVSLLVILNAQLSQYYGPWRGPLSLPTFPQWGNFSKDENTTELTRLLLYKSSSTATVTRETANQSQQPQGAFGQDSQLDILAGQVVLGQDSGDAVFLNWETIKHQRKSIMPLAHCAKYLERWTFDIKKNSASNKLVKDSFSYVLKNTLIHCLCRYIL